MRYSNINVQRATRKCNLLNDTSIEEIEADLQHVCQRLVEAADLLIPRKNTTRTPVNRVKDKTLSHLCWKSRCAFRHWKNAGRPRTGPVAEERKKCKRLVNVHLNKCRARQERRQIQQQDEMLQQNHSKRFQSKYQEKTMCTKLLSDYSLITDTKELLDFRISGSTFSCLFIIISERHK